MHLLIDGILTQVGLRTMRSWRSPLYSVGVVVACWLQFCSSRSRPASPSGRPLAAAAIGYALSSVVIVSLVGCRALSEGPAAPLIALSH